MSGCPFCHMVQIPFENVWCQMAMDRPWQEIERLITLQAAAHVQNPTLGREGEVRGLWVQGQHGVHSKTVSQKGKELKAQ